MPNLMLLPGYKIGFETDPAKLHLWVKDEKGRLLQWPDGKKYFELEKLVGSIIEDPGHFVGYRVIQLEVLLNLICSIAPHLKLKPQKSKTKAIIYRVIDD